MTLKCKIGLHDWSITSRKLDKYYVLGKCNKCGKLVDTTFTLGEIEAIGRARRRLRDG